jgi:hypothetical protein
MSIDYYQRPEISNSDLTLFAESPARFHHIKNLPPQERPSFEGSEFGNLMHTSLLEPNELHKRYFSINRPVVGGMMGTFIEHLAKTRSSMAPYMNGPKEQKEAAFAEWYEAAHKIAGFSLPLQRVLEDFKKPGNREYYEFLKQNEGKTLVSPKDWQQALDMIAELRKHEPIKPYLFDDKVWNPDGTTDCLIHYELPIFWEAIVDHKQILCRSKLDKVIVNYQEHFAIIVDYKTTEKTSRDEFVRAAFWKYEYHRAMAFYEDAVRDLLRNEGLDEATVSKFTIKNVIIAQSKEAPYEPWLLSFTPEVVELGRQKYRLLLGDLRKRMDTNFWYDPAMYGTDGVCNVDMLMVGLRKDFQPPSSNGKGKAVATNSI